LALSSPGCTIAASVGTIGLNAYTQRRFLPELVAKGGYSREQLSVATLLLSGTVALVRRSSGRPWISGALFVSFPSP